MAVRRWFWIALLLAAPAWGQSIFNCSSFATSGTCGVQINVGSNSGGSGNFAILGSNNGANPAISGGTAIIGPASVTHFALSMMYKTAKVSTQAFTTTFTFIPNGQNIALTFNNCANNGSTGVGTCGGFALANFSSGASCEGGFYQEYNPNPFPYNVFAMMFDQYGGNAGGSSTFTDSSVQLYQQNQSPCNPNPGGPIVQPYWGTNKFATSPVHLNSPSGSPNTTTGDTYSATLTYDGSTVTLNMFDVTGGGSCPGASCFTQTWSNVSIPSQVNGTTAWMGFTASTGASAPGNLVVGSWSFTANTPTASPGSTATSGGSTTAANPTFSPAAGTYTGTQNVTISCSNGSSNACYSLGTGLTILPLADNLGGCAVGTAYSTPVTIASTNTLNAICGVNNNSAAGTLPSGVVKGAFTIAPPVAASGTGKFKITGSAKVN